MLSYPVVRITVFNVSVMVSAFEEAASKASNTFWATL
jgi:hypothetical protein